MKIIKMSFVLLSIIMVVSCSKSVTVNPSDTMNDEGVIMERTYITEDGKTHFIIHNDELKLGKEKINQITSELEKSYQEILKYTNGYEWEKEIHLRLKAQNNISFGSRDEILLYNARGNDYQLTHELTHTLLGFGDQKEDEFNPNFGFLTQEGFAIYIAEKTYPEKSVFPGRGLDVHQVMKYLVEKGENFSMTDLADNQISLSYFRASDGKKYWKSYVHAGSFVKYLFETFEKNKVIRLYNSPNLETDFKNLLGKEIQEVESEWLNYLKNQIEPLPTEEKYLIMYP